jgi:transcriptional/translational regulatory protein YebC/TACO1
VVVDAERYGEDDLMPAIEAGAEDIADDEGVWEIVAEPTEFTAVRKALEDAGIEIQSAELSMRPTTRVPVEEGDVGKLIRLIEQLEDQDDVNAVHANFDVDADVLERVAAA